MDRSNMRDVLRLGQITGPVRQCITTKFLGPTEHRDPRVKATAAGGMSVTVIWDDSLDERENHAVAAIELAKKLDWCTPLAFADQYAMGGTGDGYVFVDVGLNRKWQGDTNA